jgi:hypothetical protein
MVIFVNVKVGPTSFLCWKMEISQSRTALLVDKGTELNFFL